MNFMSRATALNDFTEFGDTKVFVTIKGAILSLMLIIMLSSSDPL